MLSCAVLIPLYKENFSEFERTNINISLFHLRNENIFFIAPENLNLAKYEAEFKEVKIKRFENKYFKSISDYSRLMLDPKTYITFDSFSHILICQTDAIILHSDLNYWLNKPYDFIGAPWPNGYEIKLKTNQIPIEDGVLCKTFVGNGGLSLRNIKGCLNLMNEFEDIHSEWVNIGHAEDLFFGFCGQISNEFRLPNLMNAAKFSHETNSEFLYKLIGNKLPFGAHGFDKYKNIYVEKYIQEFKMRVL
jgi:hypothetical protein